MSVAFIHVDLDDVWALGDCYGFEVPPDERHRVYEEGVGRFLELFREFSVHATFFVVGADTEDEKVVQLLREIVRAGHRIANHSYTHNLRLRLLPESAILDEVVLADKAIQHAVGSKPVGFRAPGYGISPALLRVLSQLGYRYDSSLMPSPYGAIFRWLDSHIRKRVGASRALKAQYPTLRDAWAPVRPFYPTACSAPLLEVPVAASPYLRLPTQAGVCMQLPRGYVSAISALYHFAPKAPWVFLAHGVDLTDLSCSRIPLLADSAFFATPIEKKCDAMRRYVELLLSRRRVVLLEEWLEGSYAHAVACQ